MYNNQKKEAFMNNTDWNWNDEPGKKKYGEKVEKQIRGNSAKRVWDAIKVMTNTKATRKAMAMCVMDETKTNNLNDS